METNPNQYPTPICDAHKQALVEWYNLANSELEGTDITTDLMAKHPGSWQTKARQLEQELQQVKEELASEQQMLTHKAKIISDTKIQLSQCQEEVKKAFEEAWHMRGGGKNFFHDAWNKSRAKQIFNGKE